MPLHLAAGSMLDADPFALVDAAAHAGFDGVGLRLSLDHALDRSEVVALGAQLRDRGLVVHDAEVHRIGTGPDDVAALIDATARLGARHLLVVSDLSSTAETEDQLGSLAERCRTAGVVAALEYMAWTTPARSADAVRLAAATGSVVVVDLLHHHRLGEGVDELNAVVDSGLLGWVQLCDAPATAPGDGDLAALIDEARHRRLPPGEGRLPLHALLQALPTGTAISVEVQSTDLAALAPRRRAERLHAAAMHVLTAGHDSKSTG